MILCTFASIPPNAPKIYKLGRQIIGESDKFLNLTEKKFFLMHWGENLNSEALTKDYDSNESEQPTRGTDKDSSGETNPYLEK